MRKTNRATHNFLHDARFVCILSLFDYALCV